MKNNIILLAFLLITYKLDARVPRVKNRAFTYETIKLPQMALPENRTYTLTLETSADYGHLAFRYQNALQIPGWVKANSGTYKVDVRFFPVDYVPAEIISRREFVKDTAGDVIDTIWFFRNIYKAMGNGSMAIIDQHGQTVYNNLLREVCLEMTGREYRNRRSARRHRAHESVHLQRKMAVDFAQAMTQQVNQKLDVLLGIYPIRKRASLMIVRNRKHSEYSLMNNFWNRFQSIADQVDANSDLKEIESKLFNEITYLKNIENKYRGSKKADRKIRYMAYRNLSTIYEMLEMPKKAIFYAQKIRSNDFRKFNAHYVIADAQRMKRLQNVHSLP